MNCMGLDLKEQADGLSAGELGKTVAQQPLGGRKFPLALRLWALRDTLGHAGVE